MIRIFDCCWKSNHKVRDQRLLSSSQTKSFCERTHSHGQQEITNKLLRYQEDARKEGGRWFLSRCQFGMLWAMFVIIVLVSDVATRTEIKFLAGSYWPLARDEGWGVCWPMRGQWFKCWPIRGRERLTLDHRCKWWHGKSGDFKSKRILDRWILNNQIKVFSFSL